MPYLHLGVVQPSFYSDQGDVVMVEDDTNYGINDVLYDLTGAPPPVLIADTGVEVHTMGPGVQTLPDLVAVAKPVNWLLIAALAAGLWALSQGGGQTQGWD